jgi:lipoprotein-releasing system permease protein
MALLSLIIMVAGFNIISTLIMLVMQKTSEIGIIRSMGASAPMISNIFIRQGLWVGCFGIVIGCVIGYTICFLQIQYGLIPLPSGVFFIEAVPVQLKWFDFFMVLIVSFGLILFSTFYPARKAAGLLPVDALRSKQ